VDEVELKGVRILVVEDEGLIALMLEDMLGEIGCIVAGLARNTDEALMLMNDRTVDVLLLDIHLAGCASFDFADEMRRRGHRIVFSTGHSRDAMPARFQTWPLLVKPFGSDDLRVELSRAMRLPSVHDADCLAP
jgi:two-component SAPR family response regulator